MTAATFTESTLATSGISLLAVGMFDDPMIVAAAAVMVLTGISALVVQSFNAWASAKERVIAAAERKVLLDTTDSVVKKADAVAKEVDSIKSISETSAKNVDGNLSAVREELARQTSHSQALQETVDTLAGIIRAQAVTSIASPAVGGPAAPLPVTVIPAADPLPVEVARIEAP